MPRRTSHTGPATSASVRASQVRHIDHRMSTNIAPIELNVLRRMIYTAMALVVLMSVSVRWWPSGGPRIIPVGAGAKCYWFAVSALEYSYVCI
jgi:hypothetical protein